MRLERIISLTLRVGVISSALLVTAGLVLYYISGVNSFISTASLSGLEVAKLVMRGNPEGIILAGVIVLIFTPVARVFELLVDYAWSRDKIYTLLSLAVLSLMLFGIFVLPIIR